MAHQAALRASDADRDRVAERLREAATEGRLLTEELEQRVGAALSARTYGQLEALLADLPGPRLLERARPLPLAHSSGVGAALALVIGVPVAFVLAMGLVAVAVGALVVHVIIGGLATWWIWALLAWVLIARRRGRRGPWGMWRMARYARRGRGRPSRAHWA